MIYKLRIIFFSLPDDNEKKFDFTNCEDGGRKFTGKFINGF